MTQLDAGAWANYVSTNGCSITWNVSRTTDILFGELILITGGLFFYKKKLRLQVLTSRPVVMMPNSSAQLCSGFSSEKFSNHGET